MNCQISETRYLNVHTNILVHEFYKYQTLLLHTHRMEKLQRILRQKKVSQLSSTATGLLWLLTLAAHAQRRVIVVSLCVSRSVGRYICPHFFSQNVAVVDTKCGYVGMCNRRSAQQESGAMLSKEEAINLQCRFLVTTESGGYKT